MRVELPRDQWAELKDIADLKAGDGKAVRRATKFEIRDGALAEISMGLEDAKMDALLARIITSWDVRAANGEPLGLPMYDKNALDEVPIDTYNALVDAAKPYMEAVDNVGKASTPKNEVESTPTSSPPILQSSVISTEPSSTTSSNSDGSPNDGTGHPAPQPSSPSYL